MTTRPRLFAGGIVVAAAATSLVSTQPWSGGATIHGRGSQVLGEKLAASGATAGANVAGPTGQSGPKSPSGPGKSFTITGTMNGLYPGGTVNLSLTVNNPNAQAIRVTALSALLDHIDTAPGAPGTCTAANSGLVIHDWDGSAFIVQKRATASAPGVIRIDMQSQSDPGCEGATFWFNYNGSANQA